MISWEKSWKRKHTVTKFVCATKLFERDIAGKRFRKCWSFHVGKGPQRCWHLKNLTLQQIFKLMSKIKENDACWWFTRMLNFSSKTLKMLTFTLSTDLLFAYCQHFGFSTNAFSESDLKKMLHAFFMLPQNFGTKFKIHKKVLNICWIARVAIWRKVFFSSRTC